MNSNLSEPPQFSTGSTRASSKFWWISSNSGTAKCRQTDSLFSAKQRKFSTSSRLCFKNKTLLMCEWMATSAWSNEWSWFSSSTKLSKIDFTFSYSQREWAVWASTWQQRIKWSFSILTGTLWSTYKLLNVLWELASSATWLFTDSCVKRRSRRGSTIGRFSRSLWPTRF